MTTARFSGNRIKRHNWAQVRKHINSATLITRVELGVDARIRLSSISWEEYWHRVGPWNQPEVLAGLAALKTAWSQYIRSGFDLRFAMAYCQTYFHLLRHALDRLDNSDEGIPLLWAILGFETAALCSAGEREPHAALTTNLRNPVYLLAKLVEPKAIDDPKYLPLTTVYSPFGDGGESPSAFYHYRQLAPGGRSPLRLLVYPPVRVEERPDAFKAICHFDSVLVGKRDPRAKLRAHQLADLAVWPIIQRLSERSNWSEVPEIRIADIGAGSGDLTRGIIEALCVQGSETIEDRRFAWTLVDLEFDNIRRHVSHWPFFRKLSQLRCERSEFSEWIARLPVCGNNKPFHVALLCRLLNNHSRFSIGWIDDWYQVRKLSARQLSHRDWISGRFHPHNALLRGETGIRDLFASNSKVALRSGTTFRQLSLSDFFRGLSRLLQGLLQEEIRPEGIFYPIRRFDESSLDLPCGASLLPTLCSRSDAVVIEDVDLNARLLRRYLDTKGLECLAASVATDRSRMHTANLLCVCLRDQAELLPGKRIW